MGAAELAASEGAAAAAHLEVSEIFLPACNKKKSAALIAQCTQLQEISEGGIAALARSRTVAVLLPTTAYILRLRPPPARRLIDANAIVALGSDFNPNAPCLAMPLVMHLACVNMQLSMPEALVAATLNAAHSLGRGQTHGAVAVCQLIAPFCIADCFLLSGWTPSRCDRPLSASMGASYLPTRQS